MQLRTEVEPNEPMKGLEVPAHVVEALGGGKRPRMAVTLNGHSWSTRIAIMRGRRHLVGLSNAHRAASGAVVGDQVEIDGLAFCDAFRYLASSRQLRSWQRRPRKPSVTTTLLVVPTPGASWFGMVTQ